MGEKKKGNGEITSRNLEWSKYTKRSFRSEDFGRERDEGRGGRRHCSLN
jgi:hypothetical protein